MRSGLHARAVINCYLRGMNTQHIIRLPSLKTVEEAQAFAAQHGGTLKLEPQRDADGWLRGIVIVDSADDRA